MIAKFNICEVRDRITSDIGNLDAEIRKVYDALVLPTWGDEKFHGLPFALYGYIAAAFARIDYLAQCSRGAHSNQSAGMIAFMNQYFGATEANRIAVHMWRHAIVHTGHPRVVKDENGVTCKWLVQWSGDQLPKEQHFTFVTAPDYRILSFALVYFVEDLQKAAQTYIDEMKVSEELQRNFQAMN